MKVGRLPEEISLVGGNQINDMEQIFLALVAENVIYEMLVVVEAEGPNFFIQSTLQHRTLGDRKFNAILACHIRTDARKAFVIHPNEKGVFHYGGHFIIYSSSSL